jgi:hypothetical protein
VEHLLDHVGVQDEAGPADVVEDGVVRVYELHGGVLDETAIRWAGFIHGNNTTECLQRKKFGEQPDEHVPVTGDILVGLLAVATKSLSGQLRQGGDQVGSAADMDFVLGDG